MVHFDGEVSIPILNIDPNRYSYLDLVDDITVLAKTVLSLQGRFLSILRDLIEGY